MFSKFAKWMSGTLGDAHAFIIACLIVVIWACLGPIFNYSDTWQLVINTGTTIVTFLMVFLLQNTQNRDTVAIHLKLDEIIRAIKGAHNELLMVENLSDEELQALQQRYEALANKIKERIKQGQKDTGTPEVAEILDENSKAS
jgi:low affinity Fe/Cu permease